MLIRAMGWGGGPRRLFVRRDRRRFWLEPLGRSGIDATHQGLVTGGQGRPVFGSGSSTQKAHIMHYRPPFIGGQLRLEVGHPAATGGNEMIDVAIAHGRDDRRVHSARRSAGQEPRRSAPQCPAPARLD